MLQSFLIYIASLGSAAALTAIATCVIAQGAAADVGPTHDRWDRD